MLGILKPHFPELPKSSHALLHTPDVIPSVPISGGEYVHIGLLSGLTRTIDLWDDMDDRIRLLSVSLNIDGLPLYKNSQ